jgi:hypothetical protein
VGIGCFPQQTCPSLHSFGKRLHQKQENSHMASRDTATQSKKLKGLSQGPLPTACARLCATPP